MFIAPVPHICIFVSGQYFFGLIEESSPDFGVFVQLKMTMSCRNTGSFDAILPKFCLLVRILSEISGGNCKRTHNRFL